MTPDREPTTAKLSGRIYTCGWCSGLGVRRGEECDGCGGSGKRRECFQSECGEHGCGGYGYCKVERGAPNDDR